MAGESAPIFPSPVSWAAVAVARKYESAEILNLVTLPSLGTRQLHTFRRGAISWPNTN